MSTPLGDSAEPPPPRKTFNPVPWIIGGVAALLVCALVLIALVVVIRDQPTTASAVPSSSPTATEQPAAGPRYEISDRDLCAATDWTPVRSRGFVEREARHGDSKIPSAWCHADFRRADAPSLSPQDGIDPSKEIVSVDIEARQQTDATDGPAAQAPSDWHNRKDKAGADPTLSVRAVSGVGTKAFVVTKRTPRKGILSTELHVLDGNLYTYVRIAAVGEGKRFTVNDLEPTATQFAKATMALLRI